ncbi:hypothetical protein [Leptolyngbya sp. PCC 6406]|uniref:hypothetical protein n=1 Tax=Leptolyngbya sp. PCC 6406 TaxID=1173264 RepID=UPI0002ABD8EA|nr:hypothetical protein [Leptolyngbya sp. PCC 6406]
MASNAWFYERPINEALNLPRGAYSLNNEQYVPEVTDVTEAAHALQKAQLSEDFHSQSQIMYVAQKEGLAFCDWPEIKVLY